MSLRPRNNPLGFAARTRKNLEYVEAAFARGEDVHWVRRRKKIRLAHRLDSYYAARAWMVSPS